MRVSRRKIRGGIDDVEEANMTAAGLRQCALAETEHSAASPIAGITSPPASITSLFNVQSNDLDQLDATPLATRKRNRHSNEYKDSPQVKRSRGACYKENWPSVAASVLLHLLQPLLLPRLLTKRTRTRMMGIMLASRRTLNGKGSRRSINIKVSKILNVVRILKYPNT
jgi:hypothetical protein